MRKTANDIIDDIKSMLAESDMSRSLNGGIYASGERPANSHD